MRCTLLMLQDFDKPVVGNHTLYVCAVDSAKARVCDHIVVQVLPNAGTAAVATAISSAIQQVNTSALASSGDFDAIKQALQSMSSVVAFYSDSGANGSNGTGATSATTATLEAVAKRNDLLTVLSNNINPEDPALMASALTLASTAASAASIMSPAAGEALLNIVDSFLGSMLASDTKPTDAEVGDKKPSLYRGVKRVAAPTL